MKKRIMTEMKKGKKCKDKKRKNMQQAPEFF
jgi:hypothetical protein